MKTIFIVILLLFTVGNVNAETDMYGYEIVTSSPTAANIKYQEIYQHAVDNLTEQNLGNTYAITEQMIFAEMRKIVAEEVVIDSTPVINEVPVSSGVVVSSGTGLGEGGFALPGLLAIITAIPSLFLIFSKLFKLSAIMSIVLTILTIVIVIVIILIIKRLIKKG